MFETDVSCDSKRIVLYGFDHMHVEVDFDDVDHEKVREELDKLVDFLNKHWK